MTPPSATRSARRRPSSTGPLAKRSPELHLPVAKKAGWSDLDVRAVDTVRVLAADAVQKTGNGHPGTAMSPAPVAYLLYQNVMTHDPSDPAWLGPRPVRPVLRALQPDAVHPALPLRLRAELKDLEALRTWGSLTPGHPRCTTPRVSRSPPDRSARVWRRPSGWRSPSVGSGRCSTPAPSPVTSLFDHHIFVLASDGDIMEGVTHEACALAGHQELGNLTLSTTPTTSRSRTTPTSRSPRTSPKRYEAYGWDV